MTEYNIRIEASTQDAERQLEKLDALTDKVVKPRSIQINLDTVRQAEATFKNLGTQIENLDKKFRSIESQFEKLSTKITNVGKNLSEFYRIAKTIPPELLGKQLFQWQLRAKDIERLAGAMRALATEAPSTAAALRENANAGNILANSFNIASNSVLGLIDNVAKAGIAIFGLKQAFGALNSVFGGAFSDTVGREVNFRETVLKSQTILATGNKVFVNEKEILDPYEKIIALTGEIEDRIASIQIRSLEIAGITSNDVVEVFGIVASQIGNIGGTLEDAEDLAIKFSAALGIFGMPIYQARQEITSILQGRVDNNSYIARSLGIENTDIEKARSQEGGVKAFLEEKLAAAVAGEKIASQGFRGFTSNLKDLSQLTKQAFGKGLLDPILEGLSSAYFFLFDIRKELLAIAGTAGKGLGNLARLGKGLVIGESQSAPAIKDGSKGLAIDLDKQLKSAFTSIKSGLESIVAPLRNILDGFVKGIAEVGKGIANLAAGFVAIEFEKFKVLLTVLGNLASSAATVATAFGNVLSVYGEFLKQPLVQYLAQVQAQFKLLDSVGVGAITRLALLGGFIIKRWAPVVAFIQTLYTKILTTVGGIVAAIGGAIVKISAMLAAFSASMQGVTRQQQVLKDATSEIAEKLSKSGQEATKAGEKIQGLGNISLSAAKSIGKSLFLMIKFNLIILAVTLAVTGLVDLFGRFQRAQEELASDRRAEQALIDLKTKYKDVGEASTEAEKRAKNFATSIVDTRYDKAVQKLEDLKKKIIEFQLLGEADGPFSGLRRSLAQLNPANFEAAYAVFRETPALMANLGADTGQAFVEKVIEELKKGEGPILQEIERWKIQVDGEKAKDNVRTEAQNRIDIEKEIDALRRQQQDALFQRRQEIAQKEVEIFRKAGELRIFQLEQANAKLIEGEEGVARVALEALNNYISTRESGELEIEAQKKELAIENANLTKAAADYRFETEKRIYDLQIKAGENQKNVAKFQEQMARAAANASITAANAEVGAAEQTRGNRTATPGGSGAAWFGETGNVKNGDPGWVHAHLQSMVGSAAQTVEDTLKLVRDLQQRGIKVEVGSGTTRELTPGMSDENIRQGLRNAQAQHTHSGDGTALDLWVPKGTPFPVPLADVKWSNNRDGVTGLLPGGKTYAGHLREDSKSGAVPNSSRRRSRRNPRSRRNADSSGEPAQDTAANPTGTPAVPEYYQPVTPEDIPAPFSPTWGDEAAAGIDNYEAAVRSFQGALERSRALSQAITEAQTGAAFEQIADSAFAQVPLKEFEFEISEAETALKSIADNEYALLDPETLRISNEEINQRKNQELEIQDILKGAGERLKENKLTQEEFNALEEDLAEKYKKFVADLERQKKLKLDLLKITKELVAVESLRTASDEIQFTLQSVSLDQTAERARAFAGSDPMQRRGIDAELQIAQRSLELERSNTPITEKTAAEFARFVDKVRGSVQVLAELDKQLEDFVRSMTLIREGARTLVEGYKSFTKTLLTGGDINAAFNQIMESTADRFLTTILDLAFQPIEDALVEQFKELFNVKDPAQELTAANNLKLDQNTAAVQKLTTAIEGGIKIPVENLPTPTPEAGISSIVPQNNSTGIGGPDLLFSDWINQKLSTEKQNAEELLKKGLSQEEIVRRIEASSTKVIDDINAETSNIMREENASEFKANEAMRLNNELVTSWQQGIEEIKQSITAAANQASDAVRTAISTPSTTAAPVQTSTAVSPPQLETPEPASNVEDNTPTDEAKEVKKSFDDLAKGAGMAFVALSGIAMGINGIQNIAKGGTYNTLMGLAGVFGSIGSITGLFGGGKARGGPVRANVPYLVGEEGPEIFESDENGTIIPNPETNRILADNKQTESQQLVNNSQSNSRGSSSETEALINSNGSNKKASESEKVLQTQQAALRQQATNRMMENTLSKQMDPLDIRYESQVINGVNYVTTEQFERGMSDAANRGRALTLQVLSSSVQTRRKLGIS